MPEVEKKVVKRRKATEDVVENDSIWTEMDSVADDDDGGIEPELPKTSLNKKKKRKV